ncbi:uncharacterized protein LOC127876276 isoform X3 [Dreissena polymorpha]|uniref:uncharacterized protein LOC127876276 isoform X3 n=1 Tax=Dreissena polymorpha TaxID=45954 RepID=UPI002263AFC7|nr:uncharacterized protein LOC127876276 isoform X3 [Dreissena polymorpha]
MEVKRSSLSKQDSSFEDPFSVHPWDSLITKLCHEFSVEDSDFDNFLRSSKFRIGDDNYSRIQRLDGRTGRKYHAFFDCLEKKFNGKDETVEFLINLTASLNFHGDSGSVPFTRVFEQYKQESAKYHRQFTAKGLEPDPNFVGRVELSSKIIEILQKRPDEIGLSSERHPIGVVLCGLPGMGKTSLASQICYIMRFGSNVVRNWNIIVVNQRDKREVGELLADLIYSIGKDMGNDDFVCEFNSVTCQREKVMSLLKDLGERKGDYLVLLDNMDGHFNPEHSPCEEFLTEIFDTIAKVDNIKVVMTVCKSVSKSNASNLFGGKSAFRGHVIEFKLTGLSYEDAEQIMTKISRRVDQHKLDPRLCRQAFDACDGNPMGIKALSVLLRDPYNDDFVRSSFKTGELFNVMSCLKQSFAKTIPECLQRFIARLFVFNTNWFSVKDAQYVSQNETYVSQRYCAETIKELQRHHILERDFFSKMRQKSGKQDERSCEQEKRFAFHSIIAEFLSQTCKESACFKQEYIDGRKAFLSYFCKRNRKIWPEDECSQSVRNKGTFGRTQAAPQLVFQTDLRRERIALFTVEQRKTTINY